MTLSKLFASLLFVTIMTLGHGSTGTEDPKKNLTAPTNAAVETSTNSVESIVQDGRLLFEMGKLQESERKLCNAIRIDPSNKQAAYYLRLINERKQHAWKAGFDQMFYPTLPLRRVGDHRNTEEAADPLARTARVAETTQTETSPARAKIFRKLHAIRLPRVAWENVPLLKALEELSAAVKQNDPDQQGILFTSRSTNSDITIRLSLRNVSAADAVDAITKVSDVPLTYSIEDTGVVLNDSGPVPTLYSHIFNVNPQKLMTTLKELGYPKLELSPETSSHHFSGVRRTNYSAVPNLMVREYLLSGGVDLNPPKHLFYKDLRGQLLIRATEQDLERAWQLIKALHVEASLFLIEVRAVELDDATATKLGLDRLLTENKELARMIGSDMVTGVLSDDEYRTTLHVLEGEKNVEVFAGEKETIRCGVQEQLIGFGPTNRMDGVTLLEHLSPHLSSYVTNIEEPVIRLDLLPLASSNEFSLNLNIIPRIIEVLDNEPLKGPDGKPAAHARTRDRVETITMWDGQTVVLGRVAKRNKNLTLFLTATLVDSEHNRVHTEEQMRSAQATKAPAPSSAPPK